MKVIISLLLAMLLVTGIKAQNTVNSRVVINELMSSNSTLPDPAGEFDDWIELYNTSMDSVDLSGWFLSDDKKNPFKWKFPEGTVIGPGEYIVIWADNDISQSGLHAGFKLSAKGDETITLTDNLKVLADEVKLKPQSNDKTFSRIPDGSGKFRWGIPTPGKANAAR